MEKFSEGITYPYLANAKTYSIILGLVFWENSSTSHHNKLYVHDVFWVMDLKISKNSDKQNIEMGKIFWYYKTHSLVYCDD